LLRATRHRLALMLTTSPAAAAAAASRDSVAPESLHAVGGTEQLQGFSALKPEDQQKVAAALGSSAPAPPAPPAEVRPATRVACIIIIMLPIKP
jgi:hypothetical protein